MCMFTLVTITRLSGQPDRAVSHHNLGLQPLPANGTGCQYDPYGDPLKDLCDTWQDVTCCLYRGENCEPGLCLDISGGNDTFLRTLLSQLPAEDITSLSLTLTDLSDQQDDSLCILSNLQTLYVSNTGLERFTCLSQLRSLEFQSNQLLVANTTFQGMTHLEYVTIEGTSKLSLSTTGMMQLQAAEEFTYLCIRTRGTALLDVWPLCLAQTIPGITIHFDLYPAVEFTNTLRPSQCDIDTPLTEYAQIKLRDNFITHVSDIATGWGFSSITHFITSLMKDDATKFPVLLDDNPFTCDCKDLDLYRMLRDPRYSKHLTNLVNLTCVGPSKLKGRRFETVLDSELDCDSSPLPLILGVSVGGIVVLAMSVLGLLFYNRIRLYRWSGHKLHPWDQDECIGENKEFDVFISHASEDEEWTLQLIEDLESRGFKVCFHKRDFEPGATIIDNIMMAVEKSKRTICILSPSFVASSWCSWEFITVYNDDIEEHQRRLLLIVKERVAWESLSPAIQRYMRDFTYIDAESSYFMDNLLYSLPVTRLGESREAGETGAGGDCQPVTVDLTSEGGHMSTRDRTILIRDQPI